MDKNVKNGTLAQETITDKLEKALTEIDTILSTATLTEEQEDILSDAFNTIEQAKTQYLTSKK